MWKIKVFTIFLTKILSEIFELISKENQTLILEMGDAILDVIEDKIRKSETQIDDTVILPLITAARERFGIPEFDDKE